MRVIETTLAGVRVVEPQVFGDPRGYLFELWSSEAWAAAGIPFTFVQDNISTSTKGVLRGLHLQYPPPQDKIVTVVVGEVFDVVVDVRVGSPTFGKWFGTTLSERNHRLIVIPAGFAHGYVVSSEQAAILYKFSERYRPEAQLGVAWDDPDIGIEWPKMTNPPLLSERDRRLPRLREIDPNRLPQINRG